MHSTHVITSQLKKLKKKPKSEPDKLGYYLRKIAIYHKKNQTDARVILMHLLECYLADAEDSDEVNKEIAFKIVNFARKFENKVTRINFIDSLVMMLNNNCLVMIDDNNLTAAFRAFFSMYEMYQFHLSEEAKTKFCVFNIWQTHVRLRISHTLSKMKGNDDTWYKKFRKHVDINDAQIAGCQRIRDLSEVVNLEDTVLNREMINQLLCCVSLQKIKKANQRELAHLALIDMREKMPLTLCHMVLAKARHMITSEVLNVHRLGLVLLGAYYHAIPADEQSDTMQYLLQSLDNPLFANDALHALLMISEHIPTIELHKVMLQIKPEAFFHVNVLYRELFNKLLTLLETLDDETRNALPSLMVDYRSEYDFLPINHVLNRYWAWLTSKEKEAIRTEAIEEFENTNETVKQKYLQIIAHIGLENFPEQIQLQFYDYLFKCLQVNELENTASTILIKVAKHIPPERQAQFIDYLWDAYERNNNNNRYLHLQSLSLLCHVMHKEQQLSLIKNVISYIYDDKSIADPKTFYELHYGACASINHLIPFIPSTFYPEIVDKLLGNIKSQHSPHTSSTVLQNLVVDLPLELRITTAMKLFDIACESELTRCSDCINALQPYLKYVCHEWKVAMLNRLVHMDDNKAVKDLLYSKLYQAYKLDLSAHTFSYIQHRETCLPNEIVREITIRYIK